MKCEACGGSGWNPKIKAKGVDIVAPVSGDSRSLKTLFDYIRERLCCEACGGTGERRSPPDQT